MTTLSERQRAKREAILEAALLLFTEQGFQGTAVPAVADAAGVGAGTIYRYFDSKEDLVNVLYRRYKTAAVEHIVRDFPYGAPFREQLRTVWTRWVEYAEAHPMVFEFIELHHHAPYLDEASRALTQRAYEMTVVLVRAAQQQGLVKDLPPSIIIGFLEGAFIGMVAAARRLGQALTPELIAATEQCAWEAIRI